jgi:hypothetical protein
LPEFENLFKNGGKSGKMKRIQTNKKKIDKENGNNVNNRAPRPKAPFYGPCSQRKRESLEPNAPAHRR